ncbi:duf1620 domain-containing protein [Moniliophthora roreri MCA 2997]|uniref:ER membrane protein complex subunit 1 n=1 Tax=Moniliophthora roreri (strain MCA 2997) TaxID=1381753 RepID=V2Y3E5_MONRO|nr:duf1620 domain-containing protein [Moniliophthora roreri MCA 2997]
MVGFWKKITVLSALLVSSCLALHESDVGVVDWHKSFMGIPRVDSIATSPKFHRVGGKNTQSVVISATESNTLAALSPVNGTIVWRHTFEPEDPIVSFHKHGWIVASLSGPGGSVLRIFNTLTGDLLLERQLHKPVSGLLVEPGSLGCSVAFGNDTLGTPDLFVLSNGHSVHHFVGRDEKWTWKSEDAASLVINSNLVVSSDAIYVVGLASSFASYTLHVTALSPATGEVLATAHIPSTVADGLNDFITLSSSTGEPYLLWLESNSIKHLPLTPSLGGKASSYRTSMFRKLVNIGLESQGMFVGIKIDGTAQALKLQNDGVKLVWDFEDSAPTDKHSESVYAGGWDKDGKPYIGRLYWSYSLKFASAELFAPHLADGKGMITGFSFPFDTNQFGTISHLAMDAANPGTFQVLGRLVITTSTGSIQLWQQDKLQWTREESLAEVSVAEFVELPEHILGASAVSEGGEGFVQRLNRQMKDAKDLPNYLIHFFKRFATGDYVSVTSSAAPVKQQTGLGLHRDTFGFRQVIVMATSRGKIFGLDSSNGEILWSKLLSRGSLTNAGVKSIKMFLVKAVGDASTGLEESEKANADGPEVVLVAHRGTGRGADEEVVLYHFNALTGENAKHPTPQRGPLQGQKIYSGSVIDAYLLKSSSGKVVVVLDEAFKVHLYPDTPTSASIFASAAPSLSVPLRMSASELGSHRVVGHQFATLGQENAAVYSAFPTWSLSLPEGEDIQSIIPPTRGPVASIGKVLGNRTTLYKYLNEHMFIVLTAPHSASPSTAKSSSCGVYLVDGVKGSIVYHAAVPSVTGACDVRAVLTENWLVYHYYDDEYQGTGQTKGYRMVSVELYEGKKVDEKIRSSDISAYSEKNLDITAYERSFVYFHGITAIAATSTKYGITSKDIIVANSNHKIQGLSRRFLDPRRPNRKPTTQEQEEYLVQYDPLLPDDQRRVLSHNYEVAQVRHIITAPSLLESTSLVFAYGLDLFCTRVAPSKTFDVLSESFNKTQLVITILALVVAIMFAKPAVRRKKLKEKWYN